MKGYRPPITSWRAFVNCEQIGYRFATKEEATEAASAFVSKNTTREMLEPVVVIRPSYTPVDPMATPSGSIELNPA
jgi:hypothetical protein